MHEWSRPEDVYEEEEEELEHEHGELMESILEDEEEIIALHRQQIEDAMEIVRRWAMHLGMIAGAVCCTQAWPTGCDRFMQLSVNRRAHHTMCCMYTRDAS